LGVTLTQQRFFLHQNKNSLADLGFSRVPLPCCDSPDFPLKSSFWLGRPGCVLLPPTANWREKVRTPSLPLWSSFSTFPVFLQTFVSSSGSSVGPRLWRRQKAPPNLNFPTLSALPRALSLSRWVWTFVKFRESGHGPVGVVSFTSPSGSWAVPAFLLLVSS